MTDLVAFIRARLDEDEGIARYCQEESLPKAVKTMDDDGRLKLFLVRYDPARVLREVEAGRKILAIAKVNAEMGSSEPLDTDLDRGAYSGATTTIGLVLIALAEIWNDHPDYDPAWTPP